MEKYFGWRKSKNFQWSIERVFIVGHATNLSLSGRMYCHVFAMRLHTAERFKVNGSGGGGRVNEMRKDERLKRFQRGV